MPYGYEICLNCGCTSYMCSCGGPKGPGWRGSDGSRGPYDNRRGPGGAEGSGTDGRNAPPTFADPSRRPRYDRSR